MNSFLRSESSSRKNARHGKLDRNSWRRRLLIETLEDRRVLAAFEVTTLSDVIDSEDGVVSLREAIEAANTSAGSDVITFGPDLGGRQIALAEELGQLEITDSVSIIGNVQGQIVIDALSQGFRVFDISGGDVLFERITIQGGDALAGDSDRDGGGIRFRSTGTLTLNKTSIVSNFAEKGGGVFNAVNATLTVIDSEIRGNAAESGGGLFNAGTATLTASTISGNGDGGGIAGNGAGIRNQPGGVLTLSSSTVANNYTSGSGGGISNAGLATAIGTTISSNDAGTAGGVENFGTMTLTGSTLVNNGSENGVGGIVNQSGGSLVLNNTIVAGNFGTGDIDSALTSGRSNLIGDPGSAGGLTHGTDGNIIGEDDGAGGRLQLDISTVLDQSLLLNGGPTQTHALVADSPAIDAGDNSLAIDLASQPLVSDQRGAPFIRRANSTVDIGAYEFQTFDSSFFLVTTADDEVNYNNATVSLREAIQVANGNPGVDNITFSASINSSAINLSANLGQLNVSDSVSIIGNGESETIVDAEQQGFRVFDITAADVTIENVTIQGGQAVDGSGGGIRFQSSGALTLNNSKISGNTAQFQGGGIYTNGSTRLYGVTVSDNEAESDGGGVFNSYASSLEITDATLLRNSSQFGNGGGIYNGGITTMSNVTLSENSAQYGSGGGLFNAVDSTATITGSALTGNTSEYGGGLSNSGNLTLTSSTLSGNTAMQDGGGLRNESAGLSVLNSTITGNSANNGGGLANAPDTAEANVRNTIIAGNTSGGDISNANILTGNSNLIGDPNTAGGLTHGTTGNIVGQDNGAGGRTLLDINTVLEPLGFNGGTTQTHALVLGSPALDAGDGTSLPAQALMDQRGVSRTIDLPGITNAAGSDGTDIGAFEVVGVSVSDTSAAESTGTITFLVTLSNAIPAGHSVSVVFNTADIANQALSGSDYTAISNRTVTFTGGGSLSQAVAVTLAVDTVTEGNETFGATISNAVGVIITSASATGTIVESASSPTVTLAVDNATIPEMNGVATFTATLSEVSTLPVTIDLSYSGTATVIADFIASASQIVIAPGSLTGSVTVTAVQDAIVEGNETVIAEITGVTNGTESGSQQSTTTISDDDAPLDFGDAPASYPVTFVNNGARHTVSALLLGATVDPEADGQPSAFANGDGSDEDGIVQTASQFTSSDAATRSSFSITASAAGKLDAWIDFNQDDDWSDIGEQIFSSVNVVPGINLLTYTIPAGAASGSTFARFRLSTAGGLLPTGAAADGEVEDYQQTIIDGDSTAGVTINVVGNSITLTLDSTDNVILSGGTELFRALAGLIGSLQINGTVSDESITIDFGSGLILPSNGIEITGGGGANQLVIQGEGDINLTDPNVVVTDVESIDLSGDAANKLTVDAAAIGRLSPTVKSINLITGANDQIEVLDPSNWRMTSPIIVDGRFLITAQNQQTGGERIQVDANRPYQNFLQIGDVNNSGNVSASDALAVIFELNQRLVTDLAGNLVAPAQATSPLTDYLDVNGDGKATAADALNVINILFQQSLSGQGGSGEQFIPTADPSDFIQFPVAESTTVAEPGIPTAPMSQMKPRGSSSTVQLKQLRSAPVDSYDSKIAEIDEILAEEEFFKSLKGTIPGEF